jgi:hypothetical protein
MHEVQKSKLHVYQKQEDHYRTAGVQEILQSLSLPYGAQGNEVMRSGVPAEMVTGQ